MLFILVSAMHALTLFSPILPLEADKVGRLKEKQYLFSKKAPFLWKKDCINTAFLQRFKWLQLQFPFVRFDEQFGNRVCFSQYIKHCSRILPNTFYRWYTLVQTWAWALTQNQLSKWQPTSFGFFEALNMSFFGLLKGYMTILVIGR